MLVSQSEHTEQYLCQLVAVTVASCCNSRGTFVFSVYCILSQCVFIATCSVEGGTTVRRRLVSSEGVLCS